MCLDLFTPKRERVGECETLLEFKHGLRRAGTPGLEGTKCSTHQPILYVLPPFAATHARYNPSKSSTYYTQGQTFSLQYGTGSLTGFFGYDTLRVSQIPYSWLGVGGGG